MKTWERPTEFDDADLAFCPRALDEMPRYDEIPHEFKSFVSRRNDWVQFQNDWFFRGLSEPIAEPREGIDAALAWRHLALIQGSFDPKHEHKTAAVAYLASLWFRRVTTADGTVYEGAKS